MSPILFCLYLIVLLFALRLTSRHLPPHTNQATPLLTTSYTDPKLGTAYSKF